MIPQIFINWKNKKTQCLFISFIIALSLYATINHDHKASFFPHFISVAKAQETNANKIKAEKIIAIKKEAKGFFKHIRFVDTSYNISQFSFKDIQGKEHKFSEFTGKPLLINLWAIWCAPCRVEMPELAQLKRDMKEENFDVIAINIDKVASPEKIQQFLREVHADNLTYYRDEKMNIFTNIRKQGLALGLPITLLVDQDGDLIASFNGIAPWANDNAKAFIKTIIKKQNNALDNNTF